MAEYKSMRRKSPASRILKSGKVLVMRSGQGATKRRKTSDQRLTARDHMPRSSSIVPELGCVDISNAGVPPVSVDLSTTPTFTLLNGLIPGTNDNNRLGRKIVMKSLRIRGAVDLTNKAIALSSELWRIMLVYDNQANTAVMSITDLLQSVDKAGLVSSGSVYDGLNISNSQRFKIVREWTQAMNHSASYVSTNLDDPQGKITFNEYIPLRDLLTEYNSGTAGTVADITSGSLYIVTIGSHVVATNGFQFDFEARLRFVN